MMLGAGLGRQRYGKGGFAPRVSLGFAWAPNADLTDEDNRNWLDQGGAARKHITALGEKARAPLLAALLAMPPLLLR